MTTITITFGDQGENHVGMQILGELAPKGYSKEDLEGVKDALEVEGVDCELVHLEHEDNHAYVLVIRNPEFVPEGLMEEMLSLDWDKKAYMRGRVVNKRARYNVCFSDESYEPDYEKGRGRVLSFSDVPLLNKLKNEIETLVEGPFVAEGNFYYDITKCGIGYHGDSERRKVVAVRLGESMPLYFRWYHRFNPVSERTEIELNHGDMYIMSEKAVGTDWKRSSVYTLRHATGCEKYVK